MRDVCKRCAGTRKITVVRAYHGDRDERWQEPCPDCAAPSPATPDAALWKVAVRKNSGAYPGQAVKDIETLFDYIAALRQRLADAEATRRVAMERTAEVLGEKIELERRLASAVEALRPFALFAEKWDAQPLRNIDDEFYSIHTGTQWAASLRLGDCRKARTALAAAGAAPASASLRRAGSGEGRFYILQDGPGRFVVCDDESDDPAPVYPTREAAEVAMRAASGEGE